MRTVVEIADAVRRGDMKAAEVLDECLAVIESSNPALNAFVHVDPTGPTKRPTGWTPLSPAARTPGRWPVCRSG